MSDPASQPLLPNFLLFAKVPHGPDGSFCQHSHLPPDRPRQGKARVVMSPPVSLRWHSAGLGARDLDRTGPTLQFSHTFHPWHFHVPCADHDRRSCDAELLQVTFISMTNECVNMCEACHCCYLNQNITYDAIFCPSSHADGTPRVKLSSSPQPGHWWPSRWGHALHAWESQG